MFYLLHVVEIIVIINTKNFFVCLQMEHGKKTPVCVTISIYFSVNNLKLINLDYFNFVLSDNIIYLNYFTQMLNLTVISYISLWVCFCEIRFAGCSVCPFPCTPPSRRSGKLVISYFHLKLNN